jgi:S-adenosylmethionine synthetase
VDRSAAYMGRWVAKNVVAAGLASSAKCSSPTRSVTRCRSACTSTPSAPAPSGLTDKITDAVLKVFSFKPADIVKQLNLLRPIYSKTTNYGHFGKNDPDLTWEKPPTRSRRCKGREVTGPEDLHRP